MRVRLSHPGLTADLLDFLGRAECAAVPVARDAIEVEVPRAPDGRQARREVELYLQAWQAMNPEASARIED